MGAGFAGSVVAPELAEAGTCVRILDRRTHLGGNAYDEPDAAGVGRNGVSEGTGSGLGLRMQRNAQIAGDSLSVPRAQRRPPHRWRRLPRIAVKETPPL